MEGDILDGTGAMSSAKGPLWLSPEVRTVAQLPPNPNKAAGEPQVYFMASSLAKLAGGRLVAAISKGHRHPQEGRGLDSIVVCNSSDGGATWTLVSELPYDSCEPVLFVHEGRLYLFITPNRSECERRTHFSRRHDERIWVSVSDDAGVTWSHPVVVVKGAPNYTSGGQTAILVRDGRLYWTVSDRYQTLAAVCCTLKTGILNPASWRVSELVDMPIPQGLVCGSFDDGSTMRCLEGNVVEVGGRLLVIARAVINRYGTSNMGAVFEIIDGSDDQSLRLKFLQLYPIPGGQCKFYIQYDPPSKLYWMTSNLPSNSQDLIGLRDSELGALIASRREGFSLREDRRLLTLWYSLDALNWIPAGWIAKADGWAQSFMYPVMVIDGEDLLVIARSARDSGNFHDVDLTTLHRIPKFRSLAVDPRPVLTGGDLTV